VPVNEQQGQSANNQIDCLELIGKEFKNEDLHLWKMSNGYALVNKDGLQNINAQLNTLINKERGDLKENLKIGIQWNTEVTLTDTKQIVSQAYCAALPVAYSYIKVTYWVKFARLILEATYEAT